MPGRSNWSLVTSRLCGWSKILAIWQPSWQSLKFQRAVVFYIDYIQHITYISSKDLQKEKGQNKFCPLIFWIDVESSIPWLEVLWFILQSLYKPSRSIIITSLANFQMITSFQIVKSYLLNDEIYIISWYIRLWFRSHNLKTNYFLIKIISDFS